MRGGSISKPLATRRDLFPRSPFSKQLRVADDHRALRLPPVFVLCGVYGVILLRWNGLMQEKASRALWIGSYPSVKRSGL